MLHQIVNLVLHFDQIVKNMVIKYYRGECTTLLFCTMIQMTIHKDAHINTYFPTIYVAITCDWHHIYAVIENQSSTYRCSGQYAHAKHASTTDLFKHTLLHKVTNWLKLAVRRGHRPDRAIEASYFLSGGMLGLHRHQSDCSCNSSSEHIQRSRSWPPHQCLLLRYTFQHKHSSWSRCRRWHQEPGPSYRCTLVQYRHLPQRWTKLPASCQRQPSSSEHWKPLSDGALKDCVCVYVL